MKVNLNIVAKSVDNTRHFLGGRGDLEEVNYMLFKKLIINMALLYLFYDCLIKYIVSIMA